jgi:hypothetical protein
VFLQIYHVTKLTCWGGAEPDLQSEPAGTYVTLDMGKTSFSSYTSNACAIDTDGAMVCWGYGSGVVTDYP